MDTLVSLFAVAAVRKAAALGLLASLLAGVWLLVVGPIEARVTTALERIAAERRLLATYEAATRDGGSGAGLGSGLPDRAFPDQGKLFLDGESDAVMVAKLQAVLRDAGAGGGGSAGLRLASTRALAPRDLDRLRLIGLEARLTGTMLAIQSLLMKLDAARPVVLIETLQLTPVSERGPEDAGRAETFDVRLEIYGAAAGPSEAGQGRSVPSEAGRNKTGALAGGAAAGTVALDGAGPGAAGAEPQPLPLTGGARGSDRR